jgi:putative peptidoglycan lipid II flippase
MMALGTVASRGTGFLKTAILVAAIGSGSLADAYNVANTIPNNLYDMLMGGILTSVIVPLIVRARKQDRRYGYEYEQRLFSVAVLALGALTVAAVMAAPLCIDIWGRGFHGAQREVAVDFAYFFLPQLFFYGVGAFAGAILNTRDRFAAPMWTPVLNNLVVIVVGGLFLAINTGSIDPAKLSASGRLLLEVGTTGGIVVQTLALWPSLRAVGFRWRPRLDFRGGELGMIGRTAGWTLVYVAAFQIVFMVNTALLTSVGSRGRHAGVGDVGYSPYFYAYQLLQMPYAIVAVSVITALMPRMSGHASSGRPDLVRDDFSSGLRLSSVIIVPTALLMLILSPDLVTVMYEHGNTSAANANVITGILAMFAIAVWPFSTYQFMLRLFYAYRDTRTPALVGIATAATNVVLSALMYMLVSLQHIAQGMALGFAMSNLLGVLVCTVILRFRFGRLDGTRILVAHLLLALAVVPVAIFALGVRFGIRNVVGTGFAPSLAAIVVAGGGGFLVYLVSARVLRIAEVQTVVSTLTAKLRPGKAAGRHAVGGSGPTMGGR